MPTTRSAPTTGAGDDRKKALEAKKAKLAQMRAEKERRLQEKKKVEQEKSQQTQQTVKEKLEIDDQVQNIIKEQNNLTTNSTETKASMQTPQVCPASSSNLQDDFIEMSNCFLERPFEVIWVISGYFWVKFLVKGSYFNICSTYDPFSKTNLYL